MRLLIADAREVVVAAVRGVLETTEIEFELINEAGSGDELLNIAKRIDPDVVLLGSGLPRNGSSLAFLIKRLPRTSQILILAPDGDVDLFLETFMAGARGFVLERCSLQQLVNAIGDIGRGDSVVPPSMLAPLMNLVVSGGAEDEEDRDRLERLTDRERQVLALLVSGSNADAIARALVISRLTARTHVQRILAKLEVHSQTQAAAFAVRAGIRPESVTVSG